jgi:hypothetical protein
MRSFLDSRLSSLNARDASVDFKSLYVFYKAKKAQ